MKRRRGRKSPRRIDTKIVSEEQQQQHMYFSSSANLIGSNEDLLRNILIHIPHKSISTFKSVSKLWLSVITDPNFSLGWYAKHIPSPSALLFPTCSSNYKIIPLDQREGNVDFRFHSDYLTVSGNILRRIEILQSCNGLLLLSICPYYCDEEVRIGVYNPTTNQLKLTPKLPKNYFYGYYSTRSKLAFDPLESPHYKVFSVVNYHTVNYLCCCDFLIHSSETDSWRVLPASKAYYITNISSTTFKAGVYWNGAIHWPTPCESCSLSFDLDKECCLETPLPQTRRGQQKKYTIIRYFGESGGHLHLIEYEKDFALEFDVLEMEKDYSKWFVKYRVDRTFLGWRINPRNWLDQKFTILSLIVNEGEEESPELVMHAPVEKMVISYNLKKKVLKKLCPLSLNETVVDKHWLNVRQFIKSPIRF